MFAAHKQFETTQKMMFLRENIRSAIKANGGTQVCLTSIIDDAIVNGLGKNHFGAITFDPDTKSGQFQVFGMELKNYSVKEG